MNVVMTGAGRLVEVQAHRGGQPLLARRARRAAGARRGGIARSPRPAGWRRVTRIVLATGNLAQGRRARAAAARPRWRVRPRASTPRRPARPSSRTPGSRPPPCGSGPTGGDRGGRRLGLIVSMRWVARPGSSAAATRGRGHTTRTMRAPSGGDGRRGGPRAAFVCVLAAGAGDRSWWAWASCDGTIAPALRGSGGFGYDPLFLPEGETRSMAEMTAAEKAAISHRGRAAAVLRARSSPVNDDAPPACRRARDGPRARVLIAAKVALALITGSVSALAEATHAAAELLRTIVPAFAARDEGRPGDAPSAAGALEGWIVVVAGVVAACGLLRNLDGDVDLPLARRRRPPRLRACSPRLVASHVSKVAARDRLGGARRPTRAASARATSTTAVLAAGALAVVALVDVAVPRRGRRSPHQRRGRARGHRADPGRASGGTNESAAPSLPQSARNSPSARPRWWATARSSAGRQAGVRRIDIDVTLQAGVKPPANDGDRGGPSGWRSAAVCARMPHCPAPA